MDEEEDVGQHAEDENTLLVDEDWCLEVGWSVGCILRAKIAVVDTHLWIILKVFTDGR